MSDCIIWHKKGRDRDGYGRQHYYAPDGRKLNKQAHRFVWEQHNGPIPEGMVIRHTCDVPDCVNPEHLLLGTQADNIRDKVERNRQWCGGGVSRKKRGWSNEQLRA